MHGPNENKRLTAVTMAQIGNTNAKNGDRARRAILRALARKGEGTVAGGLDKAADKLVDAAINGDQWAQKELYDRVDGKAKQQVAVSGAGGGPIEVLVRGAEELRAKIRGQ